jgi:hypothetical protein
VGHYHQGQAQKIQEKVEHTLETINGALAHARKDLG